MNKEFKQPWIDALRSDKFVQGHGALKKCDEETLYCCLGVFCEVNIDSLEIEYGEDSRGFATYDSFMTALPDSVKVRCEISDKEEDFLITMNDSGSSFSEIADWIEENL